MVALPIAAPPASESSRARLCKPLIVVSARAAPKARCPAGFHSQRAIGAGETEGKTMFSNRIQAAAIRCALGGALALAAVWPLGAQGTCITSGGLTCDATASVLTVNAFLLIESGAPDISFSDTDSLPGGNDWFIDINQDSDPFFAIANSADAGVPRIFRLDAGAPPNSFRVDGSGRIGLGTATPFQPIHIAAEFPAIRFAANAGRTWDLFGHQGAFFVHDATSNTTPFGISPGAPDAGIRIATNGVGFGTFTPSAAMHLRRTNGTARLLIEEPTPARPAAPCFNSATTASQNSASRTRLFRKSGNFLPRSASPSTRSSTPAWSSYSLRPAA
jgi:hypothetical protein